MPDYVRARTESGHHVTQSRTVAERNNWRILQQPATDANGQPLPPKFNTPKGGESEPRKETPATKATTKVKEA